MRLVKQKASKELGVRENGFSTRWESFNYYIHTKQSWLIKYSDPFAALWICQNMLLKPHCIILMCNINIFFLVKKYPHNSSLKLRLAYFILNTLHTNGVF